MYMHELIDEEIWVVGSIVTTGGNAKTWIQPEVFALCISAC